MCGIVGFVNGTPHLLKEMTDSLVHRGPDSEGLWNDEQRSLGLGFRRLAILDLSEHGNQPMLSHCGRYRLVFNGEIFNHLALKAELKSAGKEPNYRGHSDTEVILAVFSAYGIEEGLKRISGQFAIAVWDRDENTITLARDRLGEKPLYYIATGGKLFFASELKALKKVPDFRFEIDRDTLALFFRHNCIPAPYTIYKNVSKVVPGTFVKIQIKAPLKIETKAYWSAKEIAEGPKFKGTLEEATNELEALLNDSVGLQMLADVPLGAFLSGGIDSSLIVALMQKQSSRPVKTFTIGFSESHFDEAPFARAVAKHLKTEHIEHYVTPLDAQNVIPRIPTFFDEPFADPSQIPTFLVSQLARKYVTVSLSGDGGDELFGGYDRYTMGRSFWKTMGRVPRVVRSPLSLSVASTPAAIWNPLLKFMKWESPGEKMRKLAEVLRVKDPGELYVALTSHFSRPTDLVLRSVEPSTIISRKNDWPQVNDMTDLMMALDLVTYLPDDVLTKVDRSSMAVSLESRAPLLDPNVVKFSIGLPVEFKIKGGKGKQILRQVLYRHIPRELIDRPKKGFSVPVGDWLKGPLKGWAEELLDRKRLEREGFLNAASVATYWNEHLSGARNRQHQLWDILMFQAWLEAERRT